MPTPDVFASAKLGIGISTVAYCAVAPEGRTERNQIWMRPEALPGLRRLRGAYPLAGGDPTRSSSLCCDRSRCLSGHTSFPERELPSEADATHLRADRGVNAPERGRGGEPSSATARKLAKVGDWLLADQASAMSQSGRSSWIGR
jgi:hypothetical protein